MQDTQDLLKTLEGLLDDFKNYISDMGEEPQRAGYMKVAEDLINNTTIVPPFGESFIACHPEDGSIEHFKTIKEAEDYIIEVEGDGSEGFTESIMGGECWVAKKIKVSHFKETSNSLSDEYCQCGKNEDEEEDCPHCKLEKWPYEFDSMGIIEFHNVD